jgi:hypothetical protein
MCIFIAAFLAVVHVIPMAFYFSTYLGSWFSLPLLAQEQPSKDLQNPALTDSQVNQGR